MVTKTYLPTYLWDSSDSCESSDSSDSSDRSDTSGSSDSSESSESRDTSYQKTFFTKKLSSQKTFV